MTRRRWRSCTAAGLTALAVCAVAGHGSSLSGEPKQIARHDIPYSTEMATPHVPWAKALPGGPIRGFFVPSVTEGRDMVELMQRLSLEPTTVTIDRNWDVNCWGIGDYYDGDHVLRGDKDDFRIVYGYVEQELTGPKPFEVLVIPGLNGWSRYTRKTRDAILRRVHEGAGLVLLHPFVGDVTGHPFLGDEAAGDERIWEISPLVGVPDDRVSDRGYPELNREAIAEGEWRARPHPITEGLDLSLVPSGGRGGRFYRYQARGDVAVEAAGLPVVATRTYGKGRVVAIAAVGDGLIPEAIDPVKTRTYWDYWEYQYSLLARAVLWAAREKGDLSIRTLEATAESGLKLRLAAREARTVEVEARARGGTGSVLGTATRTLSLPSGEREVAIASHDLAPAGWPGGRSVVDVIVRDPATGATLQWGWAGLETPKPASLSGLRPNATVYREGDTMSLVTRAAGELDGLSVRVRFGDDLGRVRAVEEAPARGERTFFHRLDHVLGKRVTVTAELLDGKGRVVDEMRHEPIVVAARERRKMDYHGLLSFETPVHYFAERRLRLLRERAMDTSFTWGGEVNDELHMPRGWFGVYWYDRGPTTPEAMEQAIAAFQKTGDVDSLAYLVKKELYRRTGETRFLVRSPSFDDPEVQKRLFDLARTSARSKAVYNMDYYFVGDEGSLGSYADAVDFCWGKHTLAGFRAWLREQYGSLDALNRSWGSTFRDWDAVVPLTTEAARREGRFAPWADHRTYMEVSFARAYRTVREGVREGDPEGRIALSGTQVTNPWNGCDWHRLDGVIDDFLSYSGGNQWDIHRSFAKPDARIGFWTGYGRSGAAVKHEVWTAALQGVLHPQLFWSPSIVNPDMTFSRSGRDLGEAFKALRFEGIGRLLMEAERLDDGVAVHYSMPSVHAAGILGQHDREEAKKGGTSFPANRDGWVGILDDLGLSFRFLATPQVEDGALQGKRVFVLPYSTALSEREVAAIRSFVEQGGLLFADATPGLFDEHVAWRQTGALDDLFGLAALAPRTRLAAAARQKGLVRATASGSAIGLRAADLSGLEALEPALRAKQGSPLLRVDDAELAIVNRVGKGRTLYLNALLDRKDASRDAWRAVVRMILNDAGVRPAVSVADLAGQPVTQVRAARYRFGEHEIVALLSGQLDVKTSFGRDGVTVFEDAADGRVVRREVNVTLPRAAQVTNARTGEPLGETQRLRTTLVAGDALVLALGPGRLPLRLEGPVRGKLGEALAFTCSASSARRRLLRWHVLGPDGAFRPEYAQVSVAEGAEATFALPSALSDPAGEYRVLGHRRAERGFGRDEPAPRMRRVMARRFVMLSLLAALACAGSSGDGSSPGAMATPAAPGSASGYFPPEAVWYRDVSTAALDPQSAAVIANLDRAGWGLGRMQIDFSIEVLTADASTPLRAFTPTEDHFRPDCDLDPVPVPPGGALEGEEGYECRGDGDCHLIVADRSRMKLFEMWRADIRGDSFRGGCLAVWDMTRVYPPSGRGEQCTSADAAGFPIAPLLFDADEVAAGRIDHAIRFILPNATIRAREYVHPATHGTRATGGPPDAPPYGARLRLRADYPLASLPNDAARTVARAMQRYGMLLSDAGRVALTARSDRFTRAKWNGLLGAQDLSAIRPRDFDMIAAGERIPLTNDCVRNP